jgi:hypothetical protein
MSDYTDPGAANQRLSNAERDAAVHALARALADGRITTDEFTARSNTAKGATTRGDLAPLFADLPAYQHPVPPVAGAPGPVAGVGGAADQGAPGAVGGAGAPDPGTGAVPPPGLGAGAYGPGAYGAGAYGAGAYGAGAYPQPQSGPYYGYGDGGRGHPRGGSTGAVVMTVAPFVALALFFIFGQLFNGYAWSWIFFILIPVVAVIVYGPGGRPNNNGRY